MAKIVGGYYFKERKKDAAYMSEQWRANRYSNLFSFYENPSDNKHRAYEHCCKICGACNGTDLCVVSANTYMFCAEFVIRDELRDNKPLYVCKITPSNLYIAEYVE